MVAVTGSCSLPWRGSGTRRGHRRTQIMAVGDAVLPEDLGALHSSEEQFTQALDDQCRYVDVGHQIAGAPVRQTTGAGPG